MGLISKLFNTTVVGTAGVVGGFAYITRDAQFVPLSTTDYLFNSVHFSKYNPFQNPTTHDLCVQKVPLRELRPELLEKEGKLVEAFCAGVWSGPGYTIQRLYLQNKYRNATTTAHQLWTKNALLTHPYTVGTQITDHFEVVSKTPTSIVVRCGDSPLNSPNEPRASDGLFEMSATIDKVKGEATFGLKSVFYQGTPKKEDNSEPMDSKMVWAHQQYTKLWMWSALQNVKR